MPHTLWKKTRSRAYPNHHTQSQYSSSASCRRAARVLCREGGRRRGSDGNRDGELRVVVVVVGSTMMCVNGEVIIVVVRVADAADVVGTYHELHDPPDLFLAVIQNPVPEDLAFAVNGSAKGLMSCCCYYSAP
jgi:hypothetical protein